MRIDFLTFTHSILQTCIHFSQDFTIAIRKRYDKTNGHPKPTDIFLSIEVADNTLEIDRRIKPIFMSTQASRNTGSST